MLVGLSAFLPEITLTAYDNLEFLLRILLSGIFGAIIGLERTKRQKEAGIRTHCIVAVTSAAFMILSKYAFLDLINIAGERGADPSRIASQVVTGISFLGAGVIVHHGKVAIKGLTTAAGLWATSAMGMAIGAGLYWVGIFESITLVIIQVVLHHHPVGHDMTVIQQVSAYMQDDERLIEMFEQFVARYNGEATSSEISREGTCVCIKTSLRLDKQIPFREAMDFFKENEGVYQISV